MTDKIAIHNLYALKIRSRAESDRDALDMAIKVLEDKRINISNMLSDIYMEGVNMTGEYQGCWVRFKDIEKIIEKYMEVYR